MLNEADTRAKLIDPKIHDSSWVEDTILRDKTITPGRIIDQQGNRGRVKKPDYILLYNQTPVAIIEAKEESKSALEGMQQAKGYAEILDVLFAYSSNGHEIEEFDYTANRQQTVGRFPTPEELWNKYLSYRMKDVKAKAEINPLEYMI